MGESSQGATQERASAGSYSYKMWGTDSGPSAVILKQSEADAPTEAKVTTQVFRDSTSQKVQCFFRYTDPDNYLTIVLDGSQSEIDLVDKDQGAVQIRDTKSLNVQQNQGQFDEFEFYLWEDSGTVYARVLRNGTQMVTDLSSSNIDNISGGVGVGSNGGTNYFDETEIFY